MKIEQLWDYARSKELYFDPLTTPEKLLKNKQNSHIPLKLTQILFDKIFTEYIDNLMQEEKKILT